MGWRQLERWNEQAAKIFSARGGINDLGGDIANSGGNVLISGGYGAGDRMILLRDTLSDAMGRVPVIALHSGGELAWAVYDAWINQYAQAEGYMPPLLLPSPENGVFEPFYGMSDEEVVRAVGVLGRKLNYTVTPMLTRVVRAHINILQRMGIPPSLTGFAYLCSFTNRKELHRLVCGLPDGDLLWADLGEDREGSQWNLFRAVIDAFKPEARASGWPDGGHVQNTNAVMASRYRGVTALYVKPWANLMLDYLAEEISCLNGPFLLITEGISLHKSAHFCTCLRTLPENCRFFLMGESVPDLFPSEASSNDYDAICAKMNVIVAMKHRSNPAAEKLVRQFGKYWQARGEESRGMSRGPFDLFADRHSSDTHYVMREENRVNPQDLLALGFGQAVVFFADCNRILYYN